MIKYTFIDEKTCKLKDMLTQFLTKIGYKPMRQGIRYINEAKVEEDVDLFHQD